MDVCLDSPEKAPRPQRKPNGMGPPRKSRAIKTRLLTRKSLDGRTRARRVFDAIAKGIAADLGGEDALSTIEKSLVETFAGAACHIHDINAHLLKGDNVDILQHSQAVSMVVRVASRLGLGRRMRDVTTLRDLMHEDADAAELEIEKANADDEALP